MFCDFMVLAQAASSIPSFGSLSFVAECGEFFAIGHKLGAFACRCAIDGKDFVVRTSEQSIANLIVRFVAIPDDDLRRAGVGAT